MASAAQLAARPVLPTLPDGTYAVPDPLDPGWTTTRTVCDGRMRPWPPSERWAPSPPRPTPGMPAEERRATRERWYAEVYWPWKLAVAGEIHQHPERAADLFARTVPEDERPAVLDDGRVLWDGSTRQEWEQAEAWRRRREELARREREEELRHAAVLRAAGLSYRAMSWVLQASVSTAWQWAQQGAQLWERDGGAEGLAAAVAALPPLPDLTGRAGEAAWRAWVTWAWGDLLADIVPAKAPARDPEESFRVWASGARFRLTPEEVDAVMAISDEDLAAAMEDMATPTADVDTVARLLDVLDALDADSPDT